MFQSDKEVMFLFSPHSMQMFGIVFNFLNHLISYEIIYTENQDEQTFIDILY